MNVVIEHRAYDYNDIEHITKLWYIAYIHMYTIQNHTTYLWQWWLTTEPSAHIYSDMKLAVK